MSWLLITLIAYFLNAIANIIDKTMVKKDVLHPVVYVFYIAILGLGLMLVLAPFGFTIPNLEIIGISILAGSSFILALLLMFFALQKDDATRVAPMIGGLAPVFIFILAKILLNEVLKPTQYLAFIFLIIGTFLISMDFRSRGFISWIRNKLRKIFGIRKIVLPKIRKTILWALPAAFLFGVSHVLSKLVYNNTEFFNGFIWTRLGGLVAILILLLFPQNLKLIKENLKKSSEKKQAKKTKKDGLRFLIGQACGGGGMILLQYAIFLGSVSLINALQGVQYVFVFLIAVFLTAFYPKFLKEKFSHEIFMQKGIAVLIIFFGLWLIVV